MGKFKPTLLATAIAGCLCGYANAEQANSEIKQEKALEVIQITATRRSGSAQEAPLNITAMDADVMKDQNIAQLEDVARWVPGLTITDQGGREGSPIIVRGLNTNSSERASDSGTVATYLGEIPLNINLRLTDVERVEVLIGPQGTLYGAGTLGGAIRYMLKAPVLDITEGQISGDLFTLSQSDGTGGEAGFVFNTPIIEDELAVRASVNYYHNPGYMDYNFVVREPGVSLPDPDWNNADEVKANLKQVKDANDEDITTARLSLRWAPNDVFEGTLNYFYQKQEHGGNSITQYGSISPDNPIHDLVGKYDSAYRVEEPNEQEDELLSLELKADLGFAELVSASGWSSYEQEGQRDQTDLLYDIWTGYANFPAFVDYTKDTSEQDSFTQELRLVSSHDGPWNWIVGAYYNKFESKSDDREYAPGFDNFDYGSDIPNIEPDLEYIAITESDTTEKALFGEVGYAFTDQFNITLGARFYEYEIDSKSGSATPLFDAWDDVFYASRADVDLEPSSAEDDGSLFKFNANYTFDNGLVTYFTISEGFRIGGSNGLESCPEQLPDQQIICALPNEMAYKPDTTTNYELGIKSTWLRNKLHFNAALFSVDWDDAQIQSTTVNGQEIITANAGSARSQGVELSTRALLGDNWTVYATYAYAKAELTEDAPMLFDVYEPDQAYYDGADGDRLPGSPEHQASLGVSYENEVFGDKLLNINYGLTAQSDVYTKVGLKADGEVLPGYALSNLSAKISGDMWSATLYVDNLFDKYAFTSTRRDKSWAGMGRYADQNHELPELQRVYGHYITTPRTIGMKFTYNFEL
ncbi:MULTISPECIES: TonB-dependent receptor [unclassified Pseudoalteromonas]|uniref:TonB-dependent receptor n=1 Tax=unclassified Pseudoalteromonas TaxID=194690 RepID=UPI000CF6C1D5|nr:MULTISPECIES: TonB-dependent receptor [unclassified Pseudoalteromonas]MBS3797503.1 TonB-dependent receptor [Pseudoalteromonas sp. BDTF-M6]